MPRPLSPTHPNLVKASARLRNIRWAWAALFAGVGLLGLIARTGTVPVLWLLGAGLLALEHQPAVLAMVAVSWGLSLLGVSPELNQATGLDPLGTLFPTEWVERLALGFVRLILAAMAWNQFLFYRLLYGSAPMSGLPAGLPPIPEVIPNRTAALTVYGWAASLAGGVALLLSIGERAEPAARALRAGALGLSVLAVGLGVGVAFSPTQRRSAALGGVMFAGLLFLASVASLPR